MKAPPDDDGTLAVPEPSSGDEIYLDWNATTPLSAEVHRAMHRAMHEAWANPSSTHRAGRRARAVLERAREGLAVAFACHPRDVVFTSGATEANNLALHALTGLVTTELEHPSVLAMARALSDKQRPVVVLPPTQEGVACPERIRAALAHMPPGATVALMAVNHETGVLQPLSEVLSVAHAAGARVHVDAAQALSVPWEPEQWQEVDSWVLSAHKLRGPPGIGALLWRGKPPTPLLLGGAQERGLRPGTQLAVLAEGFRVALEARVASGHARLDELRRLRDLWERSLAPFAECNGGMAPRAPHVSNLSFRGWSSAELVAALDLEGVLLSSGSACAAGTALPSPVIEAMGGPERARSAVRFSIGETVTEGEVLRAIELMCRVLTR